MTVISPPSPVRSGQRKGLSLAAPLRSLCTGGGALRPRDTGSPTFVPYTSGLAPPRSSIWGDVPVGGHLLRLLCADSLAALAFLLEFVLISATVSASFLFTFSFMTFTHFRRIRFQRLCKSKQLFVFQCNWSAGRNVLLEALILP